MRMNRRYIALVAAAFLVFLHPGQLASGDDGKSQAPPLPAPRIDPDFGLPKPAKLKRRIRLWATHYYVYGDVSSTAGGEPLLDMAGTRLGPLLSERDWCLGGVEGTIRVVSGKSDSRVYNFAGRAAIPQVDCSRVVRNASINLRALESTRYTIAKGPFGDGTRGMILVPYRTIAVDRRIIPLGSVIYIPGARGSEITLPSGRIVRHDGYFFAADVGGAIKGNHIDVFGGTFRENPFPDFIKSRSSGTFRAFRIRDRQIIEKLKAIHRVD